MFDKDVDIVLPIVIVVILVISAVGSVIYMCCVRGLDKAGKAKTAAKKTKPTQKKPVDKDINV